MYIIFTGSVNMKSTVYYARIGQALEEHLTKTAQLSQQFCNSFSWPTLAYTAGLWHDLGKYSEAFQRRLRGSNEKVVHSSAGAKHAETVFQGREKSIGRILAYVIAGHHAGICK